MPHTVRFAGDIFLYTRAPFVRIYYNRYVAHTMCQICMYVIQLGLKLELVLDPGVNKNHIELMQQRQ